MKAKSPTQFYHKLLITPPCINHSFKPRKWRCHVMITPSPKSSISLYIHTCKFNSHNPLKLYFKGGISARKFNTGHKWGWKNIIPREGDRVYSFLPLLVLPELRKDGIYILKSCVCFVSHLKHLDKEKKIRNSIGDRMHKRWTAARTCLRSSDHNLPRHKNKKHNLRLFHSIDQAWKEFWFILCIKTA